MKIPFVQQVGEGEVSLNGINWDWSWGSQPRIIIRLWRLFFYFRRRSKNILTGKRLIFGVNYMRDFTWLGGLKVVFDTRSVVVGGVNISMEFLEDVVVRLWNERQIPNS